MTKDDSNSMSGMMQRVIDALGKVKEHVELLEKTQKDRGPAAGVTATADTAVPFTKENEQIESVTENLPAGVVIKIEPIKIDVGKMLISWLSKSMRRLSGRRCEMETQKGRGPSAGVTATTDTAVPFMKENEQVESDTENLPAGIVIPIEIKGKNVAEYVNKVVEEVDWKVVGAQVRDACNEVDWKGIGNQIQESLKQVDWKEVNKVDWKGVGTEIENGLNQVDWNKVTKAFESAKDALHSEPDQDDGLTEKEDFDKETTFDESQKTKCKNDSEDDESGGYGEIV